MRRRTWRARPHPAGRPFGRRRRWLAVADVPGQRRRRVPARLPGDPAPGAAAAVHVSPAVCSRGPVRCAHHLLDIPDRADQDRPCRPPAAGGRVRLHLAAGGIRGPHRGNSDGQASEAGVSAVFWPLIAATGGAGALARFAVDQHVTRLAGGALPLGTLAVNCSGALLLGLITGAGVSGDAALVAGAGAIGSYTTFSTWMYETHR